MTVSCASSVEQGLWDALADPSIRVVVADGDWTMYAAKSHEDTFSTSPVKEPALAWIRLGIKTNEVGQKVFTNRLVLSTGGDIEAARSRFAACIPEDVKPADIATFFSTQRT